MLAKAVTSKHWQCTYMICGGESAIRSPHLPASISQAFESLLEEKVSD